jgi:hypothetical protein
LIHFRHFARLSFFAANCVLFALVPTVSYSQAMTSDGVSSSQLADPQQGSTVSSTVPATGIVATEKSRRMPTGSLWKHPGIGIGVGINGINFDIAEPLGQHFNIRAGGEYLRYTGDFTSDGANINAALAVGGGHIALDYYPWHNGWRISPQVRFAIQTEANISVIVPAGQEISLNGGDYVSSAQDPLRGTGHVDTRKAAPGISIGYGNLSPRHGAHWSFPVELGFYYVGQPNLQVTFTGSACDPTQPAAIGCQTVTTDPGFQSDLKKFIARQNNNLSYASFFPIASIGMGYRF